MNGKSIVSRTVAIPMRDGIVLAADVYQPSGGGRYPVLVMRTPYSRTKAETLLYAHPSWYARHGYAVVVQDVRGRYESPGTFAPLQKEGTDGFDTVDWAASQPWSNGRVGMYGFSYPGIVQLFAAAERPAALQAIAPALAPAELREGWLFNGGAFALAFGLGWTLDLLVDIARRHRPDLLANVVSAASDPSPLYAFRPLNGLPILRDAELGGFYLDWLEHANDPPYWEPLGVASRYADMEVPCLHIGGWYDVFVDSTVQNYAEVRATARTEQIRDAQR
jgi:putative CocE/NonD family hydrolase